MEERLRQYIRDDNIYTLHRQGKLPCPSDYEQFCVEHCKDIDDMLKENEYLKHKIKEIKKYVNSFREATTTNSPRRIIDEQYDVLLEMVENIGYLEE